VQIPLAESDPEKFYQLLNQKLEKVVSEEKEKNFVKPRSCSNSSLPAVLNTTSVGEFYPRSQIDTSTKHNNTATINNDVSINNKHHFYQLTSKSKEVDIDSQSCNSLLNFNNTSRMNASIASNSYYQLETTLKNTKKQPKPDRSSANLEKTANYKQTGKLLEQNNNISDSGVSIRSAVSIERVNDWLGYQHQQSKSQMTNEEFSKNTNKLLPTQQTNINSQESNKGKNTNLKTNVKTTVAYYLPGEELAYISTFNGQQLTLAEFKQLITKKGQFRLDHMNYFYLSLLITTQS
jgi:hypothetical protein